MMTIYLFEKREKNIFRKIIQKELKKKRKRKKKVIPTVRVLT